MNSDRPMPLLLIEDDLSECVRYKDCTNHRTNIRFVGMTSSSYEGIKLVQSHLPEGVILDLELHKGKGSGLQFLSDMDELKLRVRPIIIVVTNSASTLVYNYVHESGADLVFYKKQTDYSPDMVINSMLALRKSLYLTNDNAPPRNLQSIESPDDWRIRVSDRINTELDLIGISAHLKGRNYLFEAIFLLLQAKQTDQEGSLSVINQICNTHKRAYTSITRAMQTAINYAWKTSSIDDLQQYYTAKININTGVPSPTEFIYYYAEKIKRAI